MEQTYVFEGVEVVKTGRVAVKNITKRGSLIPVKSFEIVEIEPLDKSMDWKKWIDPNQLFTVKNEEDK